MQEQQQQQRQCQNCVGCVFDQQAVRALQLLLRLACLWDGWYGIEDRSKRHLEAEVPDTLSSRTLLNNITTACNRDGCGEMLSPGVSISTL
jgi:hypothetical protein